MADDIIKMQIEVAKKRRKIDDLCSHIIVQTERIDELTKKESTQWTGKIQARSSEETPRKQRIM